MFDDEHLVTQDEFERAMIRVYRAFDDRETAQLWVRAVLAELEACMGMVGEISEALGGQIAQAN